MLPDGVVGLNAFFPDDFKWRRDHIAWDVQDIQNPRTVYVRHGDINHDRTSGSPVTVKWHADSEPFRFYLLPLIRAIRHLSLQYASG